MQPRHSCLWWPRQVRDMTACFLTPQQSSTAMVVHRPAAKPCCVYPTGVTAPSTDMVQLNAVTQVLWDRLLMPHEKNVWDIYICLLLVWVCFGTPVVICFGLDSKFWKGHPLGSELLYAVCCLLCLEGSGALLSHCQQLAVGHSLAHVGVSSRGQHSTADLANARLRLSCLPAAVVQLIVDLSFLTDMYLNFRTAYIDKRGNLVTNRRRIARAYFSKWFLPDLISVLPLHFFLGSWSELTTLFKLLRVVRTEQCVLRLPSHSCAETFLATERMILRSYVAVLWLC